MRTSLFSRLGLAVGGAAVMAILGGVTPAQASTSGADTFPPPCHIVSNVTKSGNTVYAEFVSVCDDGETVDLPVNLQRKNPVTGQFVTIASGNGFASHVCTGSASITYRKTPSPAVTRTINCT
jgi:hypothetical protein